MDSKVIVAVVSTIIMIFGSGWYVWQAILDKKVKPVLASWIILSVTLTLSFATYWTTKKHSLIGNIGGLASAVAKLSAIGLSDAEIAALIG